MRYWLMKTEPDVFSWDTFVKKGVASWDGVRNYQARNFMRDDFKVGDKVLFYHSSCDIPGIAGIATVSKEAYPDPTALDESSEYFDPASKKAGASRWCMVDLVPDRPLKGTATLEEIRKIPELGTMLLLKPGQRLSIQPVAESEFEYIISRW